MVNQTSERGEVMDRAQARRAAGTLEDVFTPEGDAVVIGELYTFAHKGSKFYGKGQCARVSGGVHYCEWYPISELRATEDL
jgi:hypothetical protein